MGTTSTWQSVGNVLVHTGLLIGDHVYFSPDRAITRRLSAHLHERGAFDHGVYALNADEESAVGWPGKAIWIKSPDGDGMYPVSVKYTNLQQIEAVQIDLIATPVQPGWLCVGHIGLDTGSFMLGDSGVLGGFSSAPDRPRELWHGQTYAPGRGVMIPTPVGDHHYPVEVVRDDQGDVRHVRVRFENQAATDTQAMPEYLFRAWLDTVKNDPSEHSRDQELDRLLGLAPQPLPTEWRNEVLTVLAEFEPYWRALALYALLSATPFTEDEVPLHNATLRSLLADLDNGEHDLTDVLESVRLVARWCVGDVQADAIAFVQRVEMSQEDRVELLEALRHNTVSS